MSNYCLLLTTFNSSSLLSESSVSILPSLNKSLFPSSSPPGLTAGTLGEGGPKSRSTLESVGEGGPKSRSILESVLSLSEMFGYCRLMLWLDLFQVSMPEIEKTLL